MHMSVDRPQDIRLSSDIIKPVASDLMPASSSPYWLSEVFFHPLVPSRLWLFQYRTNMKLCHTQSVHVWQLDIWKFLHNRYHYCSSRAWASHGDVHSHVLLVVEVNKQGIDSMGMVLNKSFPMHCH